MEVLLTLLIVLVVGVIALYTIHKAYAKNPTSLSVTIGKLFSFNASFDTGTGEEQ